MIGAGGFGLGHRLVESVDAPSPRPRRGPAPIMIHPGGKHPRRGLAPIMIHPGGKQSHWPKECR